MSNRTMYEFPKGKVMLNSKGIAYIQYNKQYTNKFNENGNKVQAFLDERVARNLMEYVSYKTGMQEKSILVSSDFGSGKVHIAVPYAEYQAYSSRIKKRNGKRGTRPFERMCADKKDSILRQVAAYSRRLNNG